MLSGVLLVSNRKNKKTEALIPEEDINTEVESNPGQDDKTEEPVTLEGVEVKVKFDDDRQTTESMIDDSEQEETSSNRKSESIEVDPNETPPIPD